MDADLAPERTQGFKVGEKKTIDEYAKLGTLPSNATMYCLLIHSNRRRGRGPQ